MTYIPAFETQRDENAPTPWTNCNAASVAMLIDLHTYGQINTSDVAIRRASPVPLTQGMNFAQVGAAVAKLFPQLGALRYSERDGSGNAHMTWAELRSHLGSGGGAVVAGDYASLRGQRALSGLALDRWQPGGAFGHAMFVCDYRADGDGSVLLMDPLGHGNYAGDRIPLMALFLFVWRSGNDETARVTAAHGFSAPRPRPQRFSDVPPEHPFYEAIEWADDIGLSHGVGRGKFAPDRPVTRAEVVALIRRSRALKEDPS